MKDYKPLADEEERIDKLIVNAAYKVHKELGPGAFWKKYMKLHLLMS